MGFWGDVWDAVKYTEHLSEEVAHATGPAAVGIVVGAYAGKDAGMAAYQAANIFDKDVAQKMDDKLGRTEALVNGDDPFYSADAPSTEASAPTQSSAPATQSYTATDQQANYAQLATLLSDKEHISENRDEILRLAVSLLGNQQNSTGTQQAGGGNPDYVQLATVAFNYFSEDSEAVAA